MARLPYELARLGHEALLYCTKPPIDRCAVQEIRVGGLSEAIQEAKLANVDVAVFNNRGDEDTAAGVVMSERAQLPCIVWDQNGPSPDFLEILMSRCVRRLVCVSQTQANELRDHPIFYKTQVIYNALHPVHLRQPDATVAPERACTTCFLGALTPSKGFHYLARAWPSVRARVPAAKLLVIGSAALYGARQFGPLGIGDPAYETDCIMPFLGSSRAELERNGVTLIGLANPVRVREILRMCAVGVVNPHCSGSIETFCVSAIEIQAASAVVVGGKAGGLRETVLHGKTGVLVKKEADLADTLVSLLSKPEELERMGQIGRRWVISAFGQEAITACWCALLRSVSENEAGRRIPLSLASCSARIVAKEMIRYTRKLPLLGTHVPTLHQLRNQLSSFVNPG